MKISDVKLEMELAGVDSADMAEIVGLCKGKVLNSEMIDEELVKRGYSKIFTVDYDDYDDWQDDDDEYASVERFPHRQNFRD